MNVTDLLDTLNIPYREGGEHRHVRSGWVGIDCPWCGSLDKFHLGIHLRTNACTCWKCGPHSFAGSVTQACNEPQAKVYELVRSVRKTGAADDYQVTGKYKEPDGLEPLGKVHKKYLNGRGFDLEQLSRLWQVDTGTLLRPPLSWRVFIPVVQQGRRVTWTTRSLVNEGIRYLHAGPEDEGVPIKHTLYGSDYAMNSVVVCEGPTDVWRLGPGAVALYGLSWTDQQVNLLLNYHQCFVCFDNEVKAQKRAKQLCGQLESRGTSSCILQIDADDLGSASKKEIKAIRRVVFGD